MPYLVVLLVIPLGPSGLVAQPLDIGLFFVLAVVGVGVVAVLMAGVGVGEQVQPARRPAGGGPAARVRAAVRARRRERGDGRRHAVPARHRRGVAAVVAALAGARRMIVFFVAGLAEIRRPPFDMPIADSELVFGYMTEYTGLRFAFFLLAEYVGIVVIAALTTVLFLGGWKGPFADAELGLAVDPDQGRSRCRSWSSGCGWPIPRLREDQLQRLCWLVLVPVALAQLVLTAAVRLSLN